MCVIAVCAEDKRPTIEQVEKMWYRNQHGGGVAWQEDIDGVRMVQWRKGLTLKEMLDFSQNLPFPFILHFRIASIGGTVPELTHPFAAEDFETNLLMSGKTTGHVVFHNGHWGAWHDKLMIGCGIKNEQMPRGPWSDTRAMAFLYRYFGQGFLDTIDQRTVTLGPNSVEWGIGDGWVEEDGIWFSNMGWTHEKAKSPKSSYSHHDYERYYEHGHDWKPTMCTAAKCVVKEGLDSNNRCPAHPYSKVLDIGTGKERQVEMSGAKEDAARGPFAQLEALLKAEVAWALQPTGVLTKDQARAVCSKNHLRRLRKDCSALGKKIDKGLLTPLPIIH